MFLSLAHVLPRSAGGWALITALLLALAYVAYRRRAAERRASEMAALTAELRRSEAALRESEAELRRFVSQAPAALWSTDPELRFTLGKGRGLTALGDTEERMIGTPLLEYFGVEDSDFPPLAAHRRALEGEATEYQTERRGRTFQARVEPFLAPDGTIVGTIGMAFDTTDQVAVEASLRESERYFRALTENASDIVTVLEADATVRYQSPAITRMLGYTPEQLVGTSAFAGAHREDRPALVELVLQIASEPGSMRSCSFRNRHRNGGWRCLEITVKNLLHDPAVEGLVVNSRDITERRDAEQALRLQTAYHEQLFDSAPEGIVLLDTEDRVLRANAEFIRLFRLGSRTIEGRTIAELIVPAHQAEESRAITAAAAAGERIAGERVRLRGDGTALHVSILATPVRHEGRIIAVYGIYRDVTERRASEEALRRREKQLAEAQHLAHVGSWEFEFATGETVWSDEMWRIYGLEPGAFPPTYDAFLELVHPEDREALAGGLEANLHAGVSHESAYRIVRPDGTVRVMRSRSEAILGEDGRPARLIGTAQDVTEWMQLEEQFRQAQKMEAVGRLAGGIAHDFNNLLTGIKGYAELMLMDLPEESPWREGVEEIDRAATRAAGLTGQLLAYSRKQVMQPRALDLNRIVEGSGTMLRRLVGEHIDFRTLLAPELGAVRADPTQLEQVIMNLAVNAADAMPDGGTLTIETREETVDAEAARRVDLEPGRYVVLAVEDTGHGMDPDTISRVFEPFFTTKGVGKGTGLGLPTAYGIVRQSGGDIRVQSTPGTGSVFEVHLPRTGAPPADEAPPPERPRAVVAPALEGATILLVEDEDAVRDLVRRILLRYGHTPLVARTGDEAVRLVEGHPGKIDLLISDVVMPGMTGPALAERLRALRPDLRVILVSGYTDEEIQHRMRPSSEAAFLQKPFAPEELARMVDEALGRVA